MRVNKNNTTMKPKLLLLFLFTFFIGLSNNDKYRLILVDNPSTTITIGWNQISGTNPTVYYGTTDNGTNWNLYPNSKTVDRTVSFRGMSNNFARITGLLPNTSYYFVIRDSQGTSQRFWFKTAPNDLSRLSFIAGGDSRNNRTPRQNANRLVAKLKPHAVFFGGDAINSDVDIEWQDWLDDWQLTTATDGRMFPIVPIRGNHEAAGTWEKLFDIPTVEYYAITFGNNLYKMFCLNSEISEAGTQLTWLTNELNNSGSSIWKGAQYHKPMRPHNAAKSEGTGEYNNWAQLFYDNEVKLVVECDSHTVKTTWPVRPSSAPGNDEGFIRDDTNGTVYMGEGCWGAQLRAADDAKSWTRNSGSFNQFKLIFVDQNCIEARTIRIDNAASVAEGSNSNPFILPTNLDVWNPGNGDVVTICQGTPLPTPSIDSSTFTNGSCFDNGSAINFSIDVLDVGSGINNVNFYLEGVLIGSDYTAPYNIIHNFPSGVNTVTVVATDSNGRTDTLTRYFYVGDFGETITCSILNADDDVEESQNGVLYTDSSDLEFVYDSFNSNGYQTIGLRFGNIKIPQGAIVNSAYIQFSTDEANTATTNLLISIEDTSNAEEYVEALTYGVSSRNYINQNVAWNPPAWNTIDEAGTNQRTPSLVGLVQTINDKNDWEAGNALAFKVVGTANSLTSTSAKRVADSFEGGATKAPKLIINYTYACCGALVTEWDGSSWSNGLPNKITAAVFSGNYTMNSNIEACSVYITNNSSVVINPNYTLTVKNQIDVDNGSSLTVENNASLVQIDKNYTNTGIVNVKRNSSPMIRLDYTAWSSPVSNQQLQSFSPNTIPTRFYEYLYTGTTTPTAYQSVNSSTNFESGKGYMIRVDNTWSSSTASSYNGTFIGVANNGTINQNVGTGYNLLGNPYPSPINANQFLMDNPSVGTLYFWTNTTPASGGTYPQNNFASYTILGGTAAYASAVIPNGSIQVGQGFFLNSTSSAIIEFNNNQRERTTNTQFFRANQSIATDKNRVWLSLNDNNISYNQILVGYTDGATDGFDNMIDGRIIDDSKTVLYSLINQNKYVIQGKGLPFDDNDSVPLGINILENGTYTISINQMDGLFTNQNIYLKDKLYNIIHDLKMTPYQFQSQQGVHENRFELIYKNSSLSNESFTSENKVIVAKKENEIIVSSSNEKIIDISVYDALGRTVFYESNVNTKSFSIDKLTSKNNILLLTIKTESGTIKKAKIIF